MVTWIELMGRHAAASMLAVSGRMHVHVHNQADQFEFWSAPGGRWRIEKSGDLVYLCSGDGAAMRTPGGSMQHIPGQFHTVNIGSFQPQQLVGLNSLILGSMSAEMAPTTTPQEVVHGGRRSWSTSLGETAVEPQIEVVIDDETGVLVGLRPTSGPWLIDVRDLSAHSYLDDELFDWRRSAQPGHDVSAVGRQQMLNDRIAILSAIDTALERREEVVRVCTDAADATSARQSVARLLDFSDGQATAVLDLQFRRLSGGERAKIRQELEEARRLALAADK